MCLAIPAKIISIDPARGTAEAEVRGNRLTVNVRLVEAAPGDYVLVHAGCAVEVLQSDAAQELFALYAELEALGIHGD